MNSLNLLVGEIITYESDTFSAVKEKITTDEAQEIADLMIADWVAHHLDGDQISYLLTDLREHKKIKKPQ